MSRANSQQPILPGDLDRQDFVKTLAETCEETGFQLQKRLERAAQERLRQVMSLAESQ